MDNTVESSRKASSVTLSVRARRYRLAQTICMPLLYVFIGSTRGVISPTLVDLIRFSRCNYEQYAQALMMKSLGIFIGSFSAGIFSDRYRIHTQLFLAVSVLISGSACIALPWYPPLPFAGSLYAVMGIVQSHVNVVCSSYIIAVWGERAPVPVHALQMMYTLGCTIGPLIAEPFISAVNVNVTNSSTYVTPNSTVPDMSPAFNSTDGTYMKTLNSNNTGEETPSKLLYVPFLIIGSYGCLISVIFFIFSCVPTPQELLPPVKEMKSFFDIFSPRSCGDGNMLFSSFFLTGLFFVYILQVATMNSTSTFIYPIAVNTTSLKFSSSTGSIITTIFYTTGTIGRLLWGVLSHFISIKILLFLELFLQLGSFIGFALVGLKTRVTFSVLVCLCGFFMQPVYPAVMAWTDRYIAVTGLVVAVIDTGIGIGGLLASYVSGVIYQRFGAQILFYFGLACAASVVIVLTSMQAGGAVHGDRHKAKSKKIIETDDVDEQSPLIN